MPPNSPLLLATQIEGAMFTPPYHGWVELTILGEVQNGQTVSPLFRPRPNSKVRLLSNEETRAALKCDGDLRLGRAVGYPDLHVGLSSDDKHHVPRHTLVVGTTGSGKSTCIAHLVERLAAEGFCVLILDVEGEYTAINEPADSARILPALRARGLEPDGIPNTYLLAPTEAELANPAHPRIRRFCLDFANLSPTIAVELLRGNDAQNERFMIAYDAAAELVTQLGLAADERQHRDQITAWDEQESGYPDLRLGHVFDMAIAIMTVLGGADVVPEEYLHVDGFRRHLQPLCDKANQMKKKQSHVTSWRKTVGLIKGLYRTGLFNRAGQRARDGREITNIDYGKMLGTGRVLIFDMHGLESPQHRNLVISDLLRGVMDAQDALYAAAPPDRKPKTAIIIEEAHEFVSGERIKQMPTLFAQIQKIARRGRKRWLGLTFATQFPQHLPSELFTLCNNRLLLRLGDEPTITRLKQSLGGVPNNQWQRLKNLPTGQAIISAHGIDPAMLVDLEPGRCKLQLVD